MLEGSVQLGVRRRRAASLGVAALLWATVGDARPANVSRSLTQSMARQRRALRAEGSEPLPDKDAVIRSAPPIGERREQPWSIGLVSGLAVPWGAYAKTRLTAGLEDSTHDLSRDGFGALALALDVGFSVSERVSVGAYLLGAQLIARQADAEAPLAGGCPEGIQCYGFGVRTGALVRYHFSSLDGWKPWVAAAVGYEWVFAGLRGDALGFPLDLRSGYSGPQWAQLQGGVAHLVGTDLKLGPYFDVSAMQYDRCTARAGDSVLNCDVTAAAWHGWLMLGVRGSLRL